MVYSASEQRLIKIKAQEMLGVVKAATPEVKVAALNEPSIKEALAENKALLNDVLKALVTNTLSNKVDFSSSDHVREALAENKAMLTNVLKLFPELMNQIVNLTNVIEQQAQATRDSDLQNVLLLVQALTARKRIIHDEGGHPVALEVGG